MTLVASLIGDRLEPPDDVAASRAAIRSGLAAVRAHLGMDVGFVGRFLNGRRHFAYVDSGGDFQPIRPGESDDLEDSYCARVVDGRIPELIQDAQELPELADLPVTAEIPVGAHMSVPLLDGDGKVMGTLCCFSRTPDPALGGRDLSVMRMVAEVIAPHLAWLIRHSDRAANVGELVEKVLADGGPVMALQPIVDLATDQVAGYEALARFPREVKWTPDLWFAEAHAVGRGLELEAAAVVAALRHLDWLPREVCLSINVSARTLVKSQVIADLLHGVPGHRITVELTEHEEVLTSTALSDRLEALRNHGARIAVDDAGSGYAGLEHILALRPDVLKLDRKLVQGIAQHPGRRAMCAAMVQFTRETDAILVAEGIETGEDLHTLRALGVHCGQGYLLGRPAIRDPWTLS